MDLDLELDHNREHSAEGVWAWTLSLITLTTANTQLRSVDLGLELDTQLRSDAIKNVTQVGECKMNRGGEWPFTIYQHLLD